MQTFLPYPDFHQTFECLDYRRLGKQRLEARQIWNIITKNTPKIGWANHPAVQMWRGYHRALALYHNLCIDEWVRRGYKNTMLKITLYPKRSILMPWWMGHKPFHASHRQTLLFKAPEHYSRFNWAETPKYEYWWPMKNLREKAKILLDTK